ncbi:MAG: hypothetical protein IT372_22680 [Polyangiaceae bacterium]|nr:hypothetical protein [Polyangiaceae bacterium]
MGESALESAPGQDGALDDEIWLLGQPTLRQYVDFVMDAGAGGAVERAALCDEWRRANDYYHELEQREAGLADQVECRELDPALAPLVEAVRAHASYRCTFDKLPTTFHMVELDRLVVFQKSVTDSFVKILASRLGEDPTLPELFRFALPLGEREAPVQIQRVGSRRYVFRSDSTDFRFHESVLLEPRQLRGYESFGPIAGVVGLVVGFGSNFLNAIRVGERLVLQNGYHRACALRGLGITHAPCIVQTVTRGDELELAAKGVVAQDPDFYFKTARPPLLKDFFDPRIRKALRVRRQVRMIEVNFEVRDFFVSE